MVELNETRENLGRADDRRSWCRCRLLPSCGAPQVSVEVRARHFRPPRDNSRMVGNSETAHCPFPAGQEACWTIAPQLYWRAKGDGSHAHVLIVCPGAGVATPGAGSSRCKPKDRQSGIRERPGEGPASAPRPARAPRHALAPCFSHRAADGTLRARNRSRRIFEGRAGQRRRIHLARANDARRGKSEEPADGKHRNRVQEGCGTVYRCFGACPSGGARCVCGAGWAAR